MSDESNAASLTNTARFRLRLPHWGWFLLATGAVVAVAAGLELVMPIYKQQRAAHEIERFRGWVVRRDSGPEWLRQWIGPDRMDPFGDVVEAHLSGREITDDLLENLACLTELRSLHMDRTSVDDAGLAHLARFTKLEDLDISYSQVTDAGMHHLTRLKKLRELNLANTHVSDAGLAQINTITSLRRLNLGGSHITNAGLARLSGLADLQFLDLHNTEVNAACLRHLTALTSLKELSLVDSQASDAGVLELQNALPNVSIWNRVASNLAGSNSTPSAQKPATPETQ